MTKIYFSFVCLLAISCSAKISIPVGAYLYLEEGERNFGVISVQDTHERQLTLTNKGDSQAISLKISISPPFYITRNGCVTISAGGNCELSVAFSPTFSGPITRELSIHFADDNAQTNRHTSIALAATGNRLWKFVSGSPPVDQAGSYGALGVANSSNIPSSRASLAATVDSFDNLWVFGGSGVDSATNFGNLNDLWKYDGSNWTWVAGSNTRNQSASYGSFGVTAGSNHPSARYESVLQGDSVGNLYLFGGISDPNYFNDLWRWDGTNWTWISGGNTPNQSGNYGTKGVASASNVPGARRVKASWIDRQGHLWIFGGWGFDSVGTQGMLNDLWQFDGVNWKWVAGSNLVGDLGSYGSVGVESPGRSPSARYGSISWIDSDDNLWLFGGAAQLYDLYYSDLWKFNGTHWIWISGTAGPNHSAYYGTQNTRDAKASPGCRIAGLGFSDPAGNPGIFGGFGYGTNPVVAFLNDLWRLEGLNWVWASGTNLPTQPPVSGTPGSASASSFPGGISSFGGGILSSGSLILFGGYGMNANGNFGTLNHLWQSSP